MENQITQAYFKLRKSYDAHKKSKGDLIDTFLEVSSEVDDCLAELSDYEGDNLLNLNEQIQEIYQLLIKVTKKIICK